ncbi:MAG: hypothetical protein AAF513_15070 [Pseudomonadota bacterium]
MHRLIALLLPAYLVVTIGCQPASEITIAEVANSANCARLQAPLTQIDFPTLLKVRGARVIEGATATDEALDTYAGLFVAVYMGFRETQGYGLEFTSARESDAAILVYYRSIAPADPASLPGLGSTPCSVFELFNYRVAKPVRVYVDESTFGELTPSPVVSDTRQAD